MSRPNWDQTWMDMAHVIARRSLCVRAQVGAVIVDATNRVVAVGYNGPPAGYVVPRWCTDDERSGEPMRCDTWCDRGMNGPTATTAKSYDDCPSLHAELNALSVCDRSVREGGKIYITGAPCISCTKALANSGLIEVVVHEESQHDVSHRQPERSFELLESCGLTVVIM